MPNSLNEVSCGTSSGNIGTTQCGYKLKKSLGLIALAPGLFPPNTALASPTTFNAWFKAALQATSRGARAFLIGKFKDAVSNGQDPQFFSYPDGSRVLVRDAVRAIRYELDSDFCYHRQIMGVDLSSYTFLELWQTTAGDVIAMGTTATDPATNLTSFVGVAKSLVYAEPPIPPANNEPERYYMQVEDQDIYDITLNRAVFKLSKTFFNDLQPFAVKDVVLENRTPSGAAAGVFTIRPSISCGGKSLSGPDMIPALASPTYILVTNAATGAVITATTVAVDTTDPDNIVVTLDTTDTDYPGAGGYINIKIAGMSVVLIPIGPYESNILSVPRS